MLDLRKFDLRILTAFPKKWVQEIFLPRVLSDLFFSWRFKGWVHPILFPKKFSQSQHMGRKFLVQIFFLSHAVLGIPPPQGTFPPSPALGSVDPGSTPKGLWSLAFFFDEEFHHIGNKNCIFSQFEGQRFFSPFAHNTVYHGSWHDDQ